MHQSLRFTTPAVSKPMLLRSRSLAARPALLASPRPSLVHCRAVSTAVETKVSTYVSKEARAALFGRAQQVPETEASISGTIPSWLDGSLIVNGGADYTGMTHMFDGYAMLTKFQFSQGKVFGSQKYVQSEAYRAYSKDGKMKYTEFATPADKNQPEWQRIVEQIVGMATGNPAVTDNASVNVLPLPDGKMLAMSEPLHSTYWVDPNTLQTISQHKFTDGVKGDTTTAHPKVMLDGTIVNFTRSFPFGGYHVYKQDPVTLERKEIAFIKDRDLLNPCWVHDMAMSANYLIIVENPLLMNIWKLMAGPVDTCYEWKPEMGTAVYVVPLREGLGPVRTFKAPTFFTFHSANAFEENGQLHIDMAVYDDAKIVYDLALKLIREYPGAEVSRSAMRRLSIPLQGSTETVWPLTPLVPDESAHGNFAEFPTINNDFRGSKHRYVWANAARRPTNLGNALMKIDVQTGEVAMWHEDGALPGAPNFVAAPGAVAEDQGVLVMPVMAKTGESYVLVLDASTMKELGRAALPYSVPYRFHGAYVPA